MLSQTSLEMSSVILERYINLGFPKIPRKEFIEETSEKVKEFSSSSIKKFMEFSDSLLEKLNLHENEQVIKTRDSVEDMLKQIGLLQDDDEEEF